MASTAETEPRTTGYQVVDAALTEAIGIDLATYVAQRRADRLSWAKLALRIFELSGQTVSYEALRKWFPQAA